MKQFNAFRLDTVNHCLWRGDERISLPPKAFDVLRYLVEHSDRLVTQDEILEALWPGTYVNPEVIKKYVLEIRKALGDQTAHPTFVATFPRRGYQFIAPVREEAPQTSSVSNRIGTIVGREPALAQLAGALNAALQGQRQLLFITGEAGIGKTTLLDAFLQRARLPANVRIARGQCVEGFGGKEAYYPVLEAVGHLLLDSNHPDLLLAFSKKAPTWLVQFPAMLDGEQREALHREIVGATRERMVREVCEALEAISTRNPLILCLEDLHWVDASTLDFLSALARRRGPAKLLLLATYRPVDVLISQSPLKSLKQDLVIHDLSQEVVLERLEEPDVAEYLAGRFDGAGFPRKFANVIYRQSGGNSLFMVAILQDMVKKGLLQKVDDGWSLTVPLEEVALNVPETLDQLIEAQFQQLSPAEQRILRTASVAGERFSVWAVAAAAELGAAEIEDACEKLAGRQQFIRFAGIHELPSGQISAHYDFLHSFYREVLYRRLSEVNRSRLHLLLAQRLQTVCNPCEQELATELALHFEGGRDYEQAVHYLILAAENTAARFAHRDSIEILRDALELVSKVHSARRGTLEVQIFEFIGDSYFALGALPESAQAYASAASRAEKAGLRSARVRSLLCAMYPLGFINPDQGLAALDQAVEMSLSVNDLLLTARAQMLASSCRLVFDDWSKSNAELCDSAYQRLHQLDDSDVDPFLQTAYAHVLVLHGRCREALALCEASAARVDRRTNLIAHFGVLSARTTALLRLGRLGEVLKIIRAGRESEKENLARSWLLGYREAWLRRLAFDFAGAHRICQAIHDATTEHRNGQAQTISRVATGYVALDRGDYALAVEQFQQVHQPDVPTKFFLHWAWRLNAQCELGNAWLLSGDVARARATADGFLESALATADPYPQTLAWDLQARVAMAEGDLANARQNIQHAFAILERSESLVTAWQMHATAWRLYQQLRDQELAEAHRQQAEAGILAIANSFAQEEPLRATFLAAAPVREVMSQRAVAHATR